MAETELLSVIRPLAAGQASTVLIAPDDPSVGPGHSQGLESWPGGQCERSGDAQLAVIQRPSGDSGNADRSFLTDLCEGYAHRWIFPVVTQ